MRSTRAKGAVDVGEAKDGRLPFKEERIFTYARTLTGKIRH